MPERNLWRKFQLDTGRKTLYDAGFGFGFGNSHGVKLDQDDLIVCVLNVRQARAVHADQHVGCYDLGDLIPAAQLHPINKLVSGPRQRAKKFNDFILVGDAAVLLAPALNFNQMR